MTILYAGDIHGNVSAAASLDAKAKQLDAVAVVQCGDFGYFWPGQHKLQQYFEKRERQGKAGTPWYFCDGNHEQFPRLDFEWHQKGQPDVVELAKNVFHVRRGVALEIGGIKHVFCGGATSIDKHMRLQGESWWAEEEPTAEEYLRFFDAIQIHKPDVIVTHEAPSFVPLYKSARKNDPVAHNLQRILTLSDHRPKRWYFGHHHILSSWSTVADVVFFSCGLEGQYFEGASVQTQE
jgi:hypothetical protein